MPLFGDNLGELIENPAELQREHSPSLPKNFPKERLPKELCQHSLLRVFKCLSYLTGTHNCGGEIMRYYECKKERDAQLFYKLQTWETEEVLKMDSQKRTEYVEELKGKHDNLKQKLAKIAPVVSNKNLRWRIAADIEQTLWRIKYCEHAFDKQN